MVITGSSSPKGGTMTWSRIVWRIAAALAFGATAALAVGLARGGSLHASLASGPGSSGGPARRPAWRPCGTARPAVADRVLGKRHGRPGLPARAPSAAGLTPGAIVRPG